MHRTHTCWELNKSHIWQTVTISWWVANRRDHWWIIFIDLRDKYWITQTVFDPEDNKEAWGLADKFRSEYVVKLTWKVRARPEWQANSNLTTWEIEVLITESKILAESKTPPFEISDYCEANEDIRYKYRYLDLRRKKILDNISFRAKFNNFTRNWFTQNDFLEVQTPIFTASSPEWARDFIIPSRLHPGKFYALPQAPQQYKQLLMVGWVDKYFQIAPCFRDEDPRADRHSCEFYQIDAELSFVEQDDVFLIVEKFLKDLITNVSPEKKLVFPKIPEWVKKILGRNWREWDRFIRLTHKESQNIFGSDKPDIRFDMHFESLKEEFTNTEFIVFKEAVANDDYSLKAMKLEWVSMSRSEIDEITEVAKQTWAKWLAYIIYEAEWPRSPILKFFSESEIKAIADKLQPKVGDMIFFWAWESKQVAKSLNAVRLALRDKYNLVSKDEIAMCWITDFPIFEIDKDTGKVDFEHNPFSMPQGWMDALLNKNPEDIYGTQYDISCNGYEILSWAIRNHDIAILTKAFEMVGRWEKEVKEKFWAMYNAFQYWVPPHGWFALGCDRIMMILKDETNIREIYAFPKSWKAEETMMSAPGFIEPEQLQELHIDIREEVKEELGL